MLPCWQQKYVKLFLWIWQKYKFQFSGGVFKLWYIHLRPCSEQQHFVVHPLSTWPCHPVCKNLTLPCCWNWSQALVTYTAVKLRLSQVQWCMVQGLLVNQNYSHFCTLCQGPVTDDSETMAICSILSHITQFGHRGKATNMVTKVLKWVGWTLN